VNQFKRVPNPLNYLVFAVGTVLLIGTLAVWNAWVSLGTEALLVPWQCNCSWDTRPALGTLPRTLNDFFEVQGQDLPSLIFLLITGSICLARILRAKKRTWLPWMFSLASLLFLVADLFVTNLSWSLSDWIVGPRLGIDAGYHRTWYVLLADLILWIAFWVILIKLPIEKRAEVVKHPPAAHL
jgi:hypothetical protein